jgi:O-antigen/teichoic acid export membrane protein
MLIGKLSGIFLVPLFLLYWTPGVYGEWLALSALASYLTTMDLGIYTAAVNHLTQSYAQGNIEEYGRRLSATITLYFCLAGLGSLILAVLWFLPVSHWMGLKLTPPTQARWVFLVLGLVILWSMPIRILESTYQTMGNLAKSQWLDNGRYLTGILLTAVILLCGGGMMTLAFFQPLPLIPLVIFILYDVPRQIPGLALRPSRPSRAFVRELLAPSAFFAVIMTAILFTTQGAPLVITSFFGGAAVALYSVSRTLAGLTILITNTATWAMWPDLTALEKRQELGKLRKLYRLVLGSAVVLAISLGAFLWYDGAEIIAFWTRGRLTPDQQLLRLLVIFFVFQVPWVASSALLMSTNHIRRLAASYVVSSFIAMVLMIILMGPLGLPAVPLALMAGEAVACYHFVIKDTCALVGENYFSLARRLWPGIFMVGALALMSGLLLHQHVSGFFLLRWLISGSVIFFVTLAAAWVAIFGSEERACLITLFQPFFATIGGGTAVARIKGLFR